MDKEKHLVNRFRLNYGKDISPKNVFSLIMGDSCRNGNMPVAGTLQIYNCSVFNLGDILTYILGQYVTVVG